MRLRVASRKSDLARWQSVQVARQFETLKEKPHIEFLFKASLGDQDLETPLSAMGAKGVFTEDFYQDLQSQSCDMVVHSWKDLPVEDRADTLIAMTLPRADVRDILLVPESAWQSAVQSGTLTVLTSSPRRAYNLAHSLASLLPNRVAVRFEGVRGNVPTRLGKMRAQNSALILAKAGLDRLLAAEAEGFLAGTLSIRELLKDCRFQVLPISLNPSAPAQGAVAVEVLRDSAIYYMCAQLNDSATFAAVQEERAILRRYGGGCHQKIGVTILSRPYGEVTSLRGLTDQGETLQQWTIHSPTLWVKAHAADAVFPRQVHDNTWFTRRSLTVDLGSPAALFVARADALPAAYKPVPQQWVWTAGVQTWQRLAERGIWVHGTCDGLGESEPFAVEALTGAVRWTKLTHRSGRSHGESVATYELLPNSTPPDLRGKTHFFWTSPSSFERARQLFPNEVERGYNACGPGHTWNSLNAASGLQHPVKVFSGLEQFLAETLP